MTRSATPGPMDLFLAFGKVGAMGFGGVAPFARRVVVEDRRWLDEKDYAALLGLAQVLPGPNTVNLCVMFGFERCGILGACASVAGLMAVPLLALLAIGLLYDRLLATPLLEAAVGGAAAGAAGLVIATAVKMARGAAWKGWEMAISIGTFVAVGLFGVSLYVALAIGAPLSIALAASERRR